MDFNPEQWAKDHSAHDNERFGMIFKVLAVVGAAIIGVLGWSLQQQVSYAKQSLASAQSQAESAKSIADNLYIVQGQLNALEMNKEKGK